MNPTLRKDADAIIASSLNAVLPDEAVRRALKAFASKGGRVLLVAAGKAAWQMAHAAVEALGRVDGGVVVTKYGRPSSAGREQFCGHREGIGAGARPGGGGYRAVSALRRRKCIV